MVGSAAPQVLFGPDQEALDGLESGIRPALALVPPLAEDPAAPAPAPMGGQLSLLWNQMLLADAEPDPTQPALLAEPPLWDETPAAGPVPVPARGHGLRRPARRPPEGQLLLF